MSELNIEQEIQNLTNDVREAVEDIRKMPPAAGTPIVDTGADNMVRAGELAAQAMKEAAAETAKRYLEISNRVLTEAMEKDKQCKEFCDRLIAHSEDEAKRFLDFFLRRRNAALALAEIRKSLDLPELPEKLIS